MNNNISEYLLNMDEWDFWRRREDVMEKSSEEQDTEKNSLALPFPVLLNLY